MTVVIWFEFQLILQGIIFYLPNNFKTKLLKRATRFVIMHLKQKTMIRVLDSQGTNSQCCTRTGFNVLMSLFRSIPPVLIYGK